MVLGPFCVLSKGTHKSSLQAIQGVKMLPGCSPFKVLLESAISFDSERCQKLPNFPYEARL